jgi:catechol 2,3-dioxygenase-like lactoylglutathione lyase family enzyme
MLSNRDAVANLAVRDLAVATKFYEDTLGLEPVHKEGEEVVVFKSGASTINVYRSQFAGTNKATAVTWEVERLGDASAVAWGERGGSAPLSHTHSPLRCAQHVSSCLAFRWPVRRSSDDVDGACSAGHLQNMLRDPCPTRRLARGPVALSSSSRARCCGRRPVAVRRSRARTRAMRPCGMMVVVAGMPARSRFRRLTPR